MKSVRSTSHTTKNKHPRQQTQSKRNIHTKKPTNRTKHVPIRPNTHSRHFSATITGDTPVSTQDEEVIFPKTMNEKLNRAKKVPMPFPRGQSWGQILVNNHELATPTGTWTPQSRRSGVLMTKVGMVSQFDQYGLRQGLTVLHIDNCQVVRQHSQPSKKGLYSLEVGNHNHREKNTSKPMLGHFHKARVHPKRYLRSADITLDASLPAGWTFDVRHFMVGQYIDVFGISKGKGFAGVMKRYGFGGQPATHGVSITHRSLGSTGQRQDPGKVFKLKKMPGHMGVNNVLFENVRIMKIDPQKQLLFVKGQIPGASGSSVYLRDAQKKPFNSENPPPFPTFVPPVDDAMEILTIPNELLGPDPYANGMVA